MKNSNSDNKIILLCPPHKQIKSLFDKNRIVSANEKNIIDFSSNIISGDTSSNKNNKLYKKYLFLKRIDLKDFSNKFYLEGIKKIFNDDNIFFSKYYKDNKVIVGKSHNKSDVNLSQKKDFNKKHIFKKQAANSKDRTISSATNITNKTESLKLNQKSRKYNKKKDNIVTDDDLKNIYQKWIEREKNNEKKIHPKKFNFTKINNLSKKEFNGILNLQNMILNKRKEANIETSKIEQKLISHTAKHRDKLLINQINNFRIKKEEIEEIENKLYESNINNNTAINTYNIFNRTGNNQIKDIDQNLIWQTSLRDYQNDVIINKKSNLIKKRCNSSNIMNLKNRYISYHSFDKRDVIFNLTTNLNSIYAQITPSNNQISEKIRDTFDQFKNISRNYKRKKGKIIFENNILSKTNKYNGLNIQGKKLINFEIELSKGLEGKRKRIVKFPYLDNELKEKIFAESNKVDKNEIPMTVKNTLELHYY